jgi:hypothetical protein
MHARRSAREDAHGVLYLDGLPDRVGAEESELNEPRRNGPQVTIVIGRSGVVLIAHRLVERVHDCTSVRSASGTSQSTRNAAERKLGE